jgi:hypothetical protein
MTRAEAKRGGSRGARLPAGSGDPRVRGFESHRVLNDLGMQIVSGRLAPGRTAREEDLSRRLGIDRPSRREALPISQETVGQIPGAGAVEKSQQD